MIGGIRLEEKKDSILVAWTINRPKLISRVRIFLPSSPLQQSRPCVGAGDSVFTGQKIAEPVSDAAVALHASITGMITEVGNAKNGAGQEACFIDIKTTDQYENVHFERNERYGWPSLSISQLMEIFRESGLVDMEVSALSLHAECEKARKSSAQTLIINACESEPYNTCDHALAMSHPMETLKGAEILRSATGAERVVIALEDNKFEVAEVLRSKIFFLKWNHMEIRLFPTRYPQGNATVLRRDISGIRPGVRDHAAHPVFNVATAFAAYDAVVYQKPMIERAVTVAGECVIEPKNLWLPIGTPIDQAIKACRGLMREPRKVLLGGPMRGYSVSDLNASVEKGTPSVLALPKEVAKPETADPCTRCGDCVDACPVEISPAMIALAAEKELFEAGREWGAEFCIECGNCSYVCPSKRPMVELVRYAASQLYPDIGAEEWNPLKDLPQRKEALVTTDQRPV